MSEDALQIAEERREAKDKGERERCIQLNEEFWRITRRKKSGLEWEGSGRQQRRW